MPRFGNGMKTKKEWILACVVIAVVCAGALTYATRWIQRFRMEKIEFIVWDREHNNDMQLSQSDFVKYIEACGATVRRTDERLHISYRTFFCDRDWEIDLNKK